MDHASSNPEFAIGVALAAGVLAQAIGRHLKLPGIVVLLAAGVVLGPELLGIVQPDALGAHGLEAIIGFAVAIILFEGGLNLELARLRSTGAVVQRLVTVGALVTMLGGALAVWLLLSWDWRTSLAFGALVIVTGPTVVTPLLRRTRVARSVQTVLEAEGVLIDAVGAITAVVILRVLVQAPTLASTAEGASSFLLRFAVGLPLGALGGLLIAWALKFPRVIPDGLANIFTLSMVLALYQVADAVVAETGVLAVTAAGLVVANLKSRVTRELAEFKEQLTVMFIGLLFILLAAAVRIDDVTGLGWAGVGVVAVLMFVVRPLQVAVCTFGSDLTLRERAFIGYVAPRGIVAAAVASLFAREFARAGMPGGAQLSALVFVVIGVTVVVQGLTMGVVARALGVARTTDQGYAILGANGLAMAVATALRDAGDDAIVIESNADRANRARERGFRVVFGNGLEDRVLQRAQPERRAGALAITSNEEANLLFARRAREEHDCPRAWIALDRVVGTLNDDLVEDMGIGVLFRHPRDLTMWALWLERDRAQVSVWERVDRDEVAATSVESGNASPLRPQLPRREPFLPLVFLRGKVVRPVDSQCETCAGDRVWFAVDDKNREAAETALRRQGYEPFPAAGPAVAPAERA